MGQEVASENVRGEAREIEAEVEVEVARTGPEPTAYATAEAQLKSKERMLPSEQRRSKRVPPPFVPIGVARTDSVEARRCSSLRSLLPQSSV